MARTFVWGVFVLLGAAGLAQGAERDDGELVAQGLQLRRQGKTADALALFERAHALAPSPRTSGQMGLAEASLGLWLEAETHLDSSLGAEQDAWVRRNRPILTQAMEVASRHVGRVTFTGPAGAAVSVGGTPVGTLPIPGPVRIAEGVVVVAAVSPGFQRIVEPVVVEGGRHMTLAIELKPIELRPAPSVETRPVTPPERVQPARPSWRPWTAVGLFALGGTGVALGSVLIATDAGGRHGSLSRVRDEAWIVAGAGAALAAAGGVVLWLGKRGDRAVAAVAHPSGFELAGTF
jgi:hypothetical protein